MTTTGTTTGTTTRTAIDPDRLQAFLGTVAADAAAAQSAVLAHLGDALGLYTTMAGAGPVTPAQLAERTGTHERYVREWLVSTGRCTGPC